MLGRESLGTLGVWGDEQVECITVIKIINKNWLFFPYKTNLLHKESHGGFFQNTEQASYSSQHDKIHLNMSVS